ncbi:hypothetical protein EVAR_51260_1 [Eumeta japonica]|uniref:Uncharacterized protein n=1 Tax=Eumeta variegata TaxID=151549 RepID=A0A4C1Y6Z0_EUMVA|nr:hypothetical protein EVAR_51260_1 [Eumeta japonica]
MSANSAVQKRLPGRSLHFSQDELDNKGALRNGTTVMISAPAGGARLFAVQPLMEYLKCGRYVKNQVTLEIVFGVLGIRTPVILSD